MRAKRVVEEYFAEGIITYVLGGNGAFLLLVCSLFIPIFQKKFQAPH